MGRKESNFWLCPPGSSLLVSPGRESSSPARERQPVLRIRPTMDSNAGMCVLSATTTSLVHMASMLSALTVINTRVVVSIAEDGLNFITEKNHVCRGELFQHWAYKFVC